MVRHCRQCNTVLNQYHPGNICYHCQEKRDILKDHDNDEIVDAEGYATILDLSAEQIKRLARKGKLAPRLPITREWKWRKKDIVTWVVQQQEEDTQARERASNRDFRRISQMLASSLRRLSNDNYIKGLYKTPGSILFGTQKYLGTTDDHRIYVIQLPKISKISANKLLGMLPEKDFPELKGITDWGQLPLDRIHEDFLVRLESYF